MTHRFFVLFTLLSLPIMILMSIGTVSASLFVLLSTDQNLFSSMETYNAEAVKPSACDDLTLDQIVTGSGTFSDGSGYSSLLIGTDAADSIDGSDGDDCLVAEDGDDTLEGGADTDICLGGNGEDEFNNCEICYGGSGTDTDITATCTISQSIELP